MAREVTPQLLADDRDWDAAVSSTEGMQLVLAGPGTGKTQFLARRAAHLLSRTGDSHSLVVLTFSRRAAAELEQRITDLLPSPVSGSSASTFHSFAHRLVETHRHRQGLPMPVLLTGPEQVRLVSRLLESEDPGAWPAGFRPLLDSATFVGEVADFVMRCHERLIGPEELSGLAESRADWRALPSFLDRYRRHLRQEGKLDYGALVAEAVEAARSPELVAGIRHVVVDEYQDTSPAQAVLAELLSAAGGNLCVAADPHQSIYSFRGADLDNVTRFHDRLARSGGRLIELTRSYRVPATVLASARRLVEPNPELPSAPAQGAPQAGAVDVHTFDQRSAEAEWIASEVERLAVAERVPLPRMAVLVRSTRNLLPELSRALDRRRIPHDRPDARLVDHPAVRMVADVVEAAVSPEGSSQRDLAIRRLLLGPALGLSVGREREIARRALRRSVPWPRLLSEEVPETRGLADLLEDPTWATELPAVDGFWRLWDDLGGLERIVADPERADYRSAWSTFARMLDRQAERDPGVSLAESLAATASGDFEATPQLRFTRSGEDRLVVTTLHQAKGLEFEVVFIADAIDGVFPDTRKASSLLRGDLLSGSPTADASSQARRRLEEERRLAYVATTRARRRVVWTATTAGIDESDRRPSRFILTAAGLNSFQDVTAPDPDSREGFDPLTPAAAEVRLRRILVDPGASPVDRLAALSVLAGHPGWDPMSFAGAAPPGPDHGVMGDSFRLSPSQAALYDECPRRYALERRLRAVDTDSPYLRFGSIVHEVLEEAEREALARGAGRADAGAALRWLEEVWERHPPFGPPPVDEAWKRRARELVERMYDEWPGGDDEPVALEMELDTTIGGVQWVGRADRVERSGQGIKIVDYKTSRTPPPLREAARSLQLGYYVLAAGDHPDLARMGRPTGAELWYPFSTRKRKVYPFDMANVEEVTRTLAEITAGIRAEQWETRVGPHCGRCSFRDVCPAWPDGREAYR
ncbi:MAG: ATP-dependent helicase [Actinomycetota bacterium]